MFGAIASPRRSSSGDARRIDRKAREAAQHPSPIRWRTWPRRFGALESQAIELGFHATFHRAFGAALHDRIRRCGWCALHHADRHPPHAFTGRAAGSMRPPAARRSSCSRRSCSHRTAASGSLSPAAVGPHSSKAPCRPQACTPVGTAAREHRWASLALAGSCPQAQDQRPRTTDSHDDCQAAAVARSTLSGCRVCNAPGAWLSGKPQASSPSRPPGDAHRHVPVR